MMKRLLLGVLLAGCCTRPVPIPPPPAACTPPPPVVVTHQDPEAVSVVRHFDAAQERALVVVTAPGITRAQVEAIDAADRRARVALTALGRVIHRLHPSGTAAALKQARDAVTALELVLQNE